VADKKPIRWFVPQGGESFMGIAAYYLTHEENMRQSFSQPSRRARRTLPDGTCIDYIMNDVVDCIMISPPKMEARTKLPAEEETYYWGMKVYSIPFPLPPFLSGIDLFDDSFNRVGDTRASTDIVALSAASIPRVCVTGGGTTYLTINGSIVTDEYLEEGAVFPHYEFDGYGGYSYNASNYKFYYHVLEDTGGGPWLNNKTYLCSNGFPDSLVLSYDGETETGNEAMSVGSGMFGDGSSFYDVYYRTVNAGSPISQTKEINVMSKDGSATKVFITTDGGMCFTIDGHIYSLGDSPARYSLK
jgi:hypothetical protein